ncbi:hypothetical protein AO715_14645 [Xanthomonas sp. Mitacek01]|nr:hypothetical protein AO715_14645 [Xanthomonas sp. Mitacek01]
MALAHARTFLLALISSERLNVRLERLCNEALESTCILLLCSINTHRSPEQLGTRLPMSGRS